MSSSDPVDPAEERERRIEKLCREYGAFILDALRREGIHGDAAKDLAQEAKLILREHIEEERPLPNPEAFLVRVIRYLAKNHRRFEARRAHAEVDLEIFPSRAQNPEEAAQTRELEDKTIRYLTYLPEQLAEAFLYVDVLGDTIDEAAEKLGRPRGTVAWQRERAIEELRRLARESERETASGRRRRPTPPSR